MTVLRTPDERFANLPDFSYEPNYLDVQDQDLGTLRLAYIDEGPKDAPVVLCMHGEPSWSFLYRKMIPIFLNAGYRVLAPDLIGFGRSDKPAERSAYTYRSHVAWMTSWFNSFGLNDVTLVAQDWGGFIGLRMVADMPEKFARISISNTGLPTGDMEPPESLVNWIGFTQTVEEFDCGFCINNFGQGSLSEAEKDAYRAPFPSEEFMAGAREFPAIVPVKPDDVGVGDNLAARKVFTQWEKPMLLCYADNDTATKPLAQFFMDEVPGTKGQPHITLHGHHFIQEEDGERWANAIIEWMSTL